MEKTIETAIPYAERIAKADQMAEDLRSLLSCTRGPSCPDCPPAARHSLGEYLRMREEDGAFVDGHFVPQAPLDAVAVALARSAHAFIAIDEWLWIERRIGDLLAAMQRYSQAGMVIPVEWIEETSETVYALCLTLSNLEQKLQRANALPQQPASESREERQQTK